MKTQILFYQEGVIIWFSDGSLTELLTTKIEFLNAIQKARKEQVITNTEQYDLWTVLYRMNAETIATESALDNIIILMLIYYEGNPVTKPWFLICDKQAEKNNLVPRHGHIGFDIDNKPHQLPWALWNKKEANSIVDTFYKYGLLKETDYKLLKQSIQSSVLPAVDTRSN